MYIWLLFVLKSVLFFKLSKVRHTYRVVLAFDGAVWLSIYGGLFMGMSAQSAHLLWIILYTFGSVLMFVDVIYFGYFNEWVSVHMIKSAGLAMSVLDSVKELMTFKRLVFLLDLPILWVLYRRWETGGSVDDYRIVLTGVGVAAIVILLADSKRRKAISRQSFIGFHCKDIYRAMTGPMVPFDREEGDELAEAVIRRSQTPKNPYTANAKGKNVLLIQVESLQNFCIGKTYNGVELTPNLNRFVHAQGSVYFDHFYQVLGHGNTSDAEFVSQNSLYPSVREASCFRYGKVDFVGLPSILKKAGYATYAYHGFDGAFYARNTLFAAEGFDRFVAGADYREGKKVGMGLNDGDFYAQTVNYLQRLKDEKSPFYALVISLSSHHPFLMPKELQKVPLLPEDEGTLLGRYINAIHYADAMLGKFLDDLKTKGILDNAIVAIHGDHYGVSNVLEENRQSMERFLNRPYTYEAMLNVPLILNLGEDVPAVVDHTTGSFLDIMPTLLNLLGLENSDGIMFGTDLFSEAHRQIVPQQTYMRRGSFISDEVLFDFSWDGIVENSTAQERHTQKIIDPTPYFHLSGEIVAEIQLNDWLLDHNKIRRKRGRGVTKDAK